LRVGVAGLGFRVQGSTRWTTTPSKAPESGGRVIKFARENALKSTASGLVDFWKERCSPPSGRDETALRMTKLPWRDAGPPNHYDDPVDSDRYVVNKDLSLLG